MVQSCLSLSWRFRVPILQPESPASLVAKLLYSKLGSRVRDYTYVDFCAGAGGPTPHIERHLNKQLGTTLHNTDEQQQLLNGDTEPVKFVLTDLYPHIKEWQQVCGKSTNLSFVAKPVDATNAPPDLIGGDKKVFRIFNLAFHHFDDELATSILRNTLETADGFACVSLSVVPLTLS